MHRSGRQLHNKGRYAFMYVCVYVCMYGLTIKRWHTHIHIHTDIPLHTLEQYMHVCIHTYMQTNIHACTCATQYMHVHMHTYLPTCIQTYTHAYIHTQCMPTYIHAYITISSSIPWCFIPMHACIHTYIHAYIHACIHTWHSNRGMYCLALESNA